MEITNETLTQSIMIVKKTTNSSFLLDKQRTEIPQKPTPNKKNHWAITINVSPKKSIQKQKWGEIKNFQQENVLNNLITEAERYLNIDVQRTYELTKQGNVHLHGLVFCEPWRVDMLQTFIHKKLGFPRLASHICCHVEETIVKFNYWYNYMNKQTGAMPMIT